MLNADRMRARFTRRWGVQRRETDIVPPCDKSLRVAGSTRHPLANPSMRIGVPRFWLPIVACHPLLML